MVFCCKHAVHISINKKSKVQRLKIINTSGCVGICQEFIPRISQKPYQQFN